MRSARASRTCLIPTIAARSRARREGADMLYTRCTAAAASVVLVFAGPRLSRSPEPLQGLPIRRLAQLLKRALSDLPYSLTGHSHERADLLERHRLAALFESVIEIENLALARREILLEDAVDELAHQLAVGVLFDLAALLA